MYKSFEDFATCPADPFPLHANHGYYPSVRRLKWGITRLHPNERPTVRAIILRDDYEPKDMMLYDKFRLTDHMPGHRYYLGYFIEGELSPTCQLMLQAIKQA